MMEENKGVFLAGSDALVYLVEPVHKKIFHNICLGPFKYRIHWNINIQKKKLFTKK